jgi:hypothetical protein
MERFLRQAWVVLLPTFAVLLGVSLTVYYQFECLPVAIFVGALSSLCFVVGATSFVLDLRWVLQEERSKKTKDGWPRLR